MTTLKETSAGGIVYRVRDGRIEVLLIERRTQSGGREFMVPKGHIEGNEKAKEAAVREIAEETGIPESELFLVKFATKINFTFVATHMEGSPTINKDVFLFLVRHDGQSIPAIHVHDGESKLFVGVGWYDIDDVRRLPVKPDVADIIDRNMIYLT